MATNKKLKSRVIKSKKLNKSRFPKWTKFVLIGLVAVVGIAVIVRTFASGGTVNTATIIGGGALSDPNSATSMVRSPITLEACRMSDTPGEGAANRVYVGAKPVISAYAADKLNAVWDKYYPEYHINGQNVTYAADYQLPQSVYYEANYIYDRDNPTDTSSPYRDFLLPSEGYPKFYSGDLWKTGSLDSSLLAYPGPAIKKIWDNGTIYGRQAKYVDSPAGGINAKPNSPFPASSNISTTEQSSSGSANSSTESSKSTSSSTGNISRFKPSSRTNNSGQSTTTSNTNTNQSATTPGNSTNKSTTPSNSSTRQTNTTNNMYQSNPNDVSKLNMILGTVTNRTNPLLNMYPGVLPGRTSWSALEGPLAKYNDARCRESQPGNSDPYGCGNDPSKYDPINNPNPFIKFVISWFGGRSVGSVGENSKLLVDSDVKVVRFKDLPKCGADPVQVRSQIDSKANFSEVIYANYERAFNQIKAAGIDVGVAGPGQDKMEEIFLNNGISPIGSLGRSYWTGLPPRGNASGLPGYGSYGSAAYPDPI